MNGSIHKTLIKRLALTWLGLSVLVGAGVFVFEYEKIDQYVVDLAREETSVFIEGELRSFGDESPESRRLLEEKSLKRLMASRFVLVEYYGKDKRSLAEAVKPEYEALGDRLKSLRHAHLLGGKLNYDTLEMDGQSYILVTAPLSGPAGDVQGYFEGIYHVEPRALSDINERVVLSLVLALAMIFLTTLVLYPVILSLNRGLVRYARDLLSANMGTLETLGNAIAKRDSDTNAHNYRVTLYAIRIGERMELDRESMRDLIKGAFLHDVGKIAISDAILLKPGKLTPEEFEIMKTHVSHGEDILQGRRWLEGAMDIVRFHHEKYDGSGYLAGLGGANIPLGARIFCLADVFDALTSKRPYKEPFSFEKSITIMEEESARHFDPQALRAFKDIAAQAHADMSQADVPTLQAALREQIRLYF